MDNDEVKDEILDAFKWVRSYRVLDTTGSGHYLEVAKDQDLDGDGIVNRRGYLYLCAKDCDEFIVSWWLSLFVIIVKQVT